MAKFRIGHSGITWGYDVQTTEEAIRDVAELGYCAYETFGAVIEQYDRENPGGFGALLERHEIPLAAIYCGTSFIEPTKAKDDIETVIRYAKRARELGATTIVLQAGRRQSEPYTQWRGMADVFDEIGRQAAEIGMITTIHPHTGTLIETRAEIDAILDAVDSNMVFFAPDTGQIAKAGDDAIEALRTYKTIIRHVHLKDYGAGQETGYAGYVPVGSGVVDIPAIFQILEEVNFDDWISVELDGTPQAPRPPREAAAMSKNYLEKLLGEKADW